MALKYTSLDDIPSLHASQRTFFESGKTREYSFRVRQLKQLKKLFAENEKRLQQVQLEDQNVLKRKIVFANCTVSPRLFFRSQIDVIEKNIATCFYIGFGVRSREERGRRTFNRDCDHIDRSFRRAGLCCWQIDNVVVNVRGMSFSF